MPRPTVRSARSLALALAPGTLLAGIAGGMVFPIFPIVGHQVGMSNSFVGVILAANRASRVAAAPLVGVLADRIGARRTLLIGLALQIAVIAMYLFGLIAHHEAGAFLIGRLLHGPGTACVFIAASAMAMHASAGASASAAATVRAANVIGVPIGFAIGGLVAEQLGNVNTFAVAGAAICVALAAGFATLPDVGGPVARRPSVIAALGEMRDRRVLAIGGINFAIGFAAGGMVLSTMGFLVQSRHLVVFGRDARGTSGLLMAILSITDALFTGLAGRLGDRYDAHGKVCAIALGLLALGLAVIGLTGNELGTALGVAIVGLGAAGLGTSVLVLLGAIVAPDRRGTAAGMLQLCGDVGSMLGPLVGTAVFADSTMTPYLFTTALMLGFVPIALWLSRTTDGRRTHAA